MAIDLIKFIKGIRIRNDSDTTKELQLDVSNSATTSTRTTISSSQTANRTIALPDASTTLVGHDTAQTLTNKTINADNNTITNIDNADIKAGAAIDASKIADGTVSSTEFQYLGGVTSDIQTQIDSKASTASLSAHTGASTGVHGVTGSVVGTTDTQSLSNKTLDNTNTANLKDTLLTIQDDSDATKQVRLQVSGVTTGTTRTLAVPDADTTLVGHDATQTLTNKTLIDNTVAFADESDTTKQMKLQLSGITTATTRTLTVPDTNTTIAGTDATQTLSNKSFSDAVTLAEIATPATPSSGNGKIYFKNDGFLYQLNDDGSESKVGAGSGGINYILNPDAESNTSGWTTYADAAASRPVDGTGDSPNVTWTRSTSSPLRNTANFLFTKDAVNRQGQGVAYDFTISRADQAKVMQISFDYEIGSGTYSGGTSSTDSDLIAYIYDVTNAQLIEPAPFKLDGGVIGTQYQFKANFQTNSNSQSYRLILHVATTSASAFTVKMDNFVVGPQVSAQGAVVTEPAAYTPVFTGFGTVSGVNFKSWRVGKFLHVEGTFTAGTPTATEGRITLGFAGASGNVTTVSTLPTISRAGDFNRNAASSVFFSHGTILQEASKSYMTLGLETSTTNGLTKQNGDALVDASALVSIQARFEIEGWGTSQVLSQDTDTRVVATVMQLSSSQTGVNPNNSAVKINIDSAPFIDTHGAASASNRIVAKVPGNYNITGRITLQGANVVGGAEYRAVVYKNGSEIIRGQSLTSIASTPGQLVVNGLVKAVAGDYFELYIFTTANNSASTLTVYGDSSEPAYTSLSINRLSGPSQIAATENILMSYSRSTTQTISTNTVTTLIWTDKFKDTHGMMNTSTGVVTIPSPGDYDLFTILEIDQNTTGRRQLSIKKNGIDYRNLENATGSGAGATNQLLQGSTILENLKTGDTIEIYLFHDSGTNRTAFPNGTGWSFFQLARRSGV